MLFAKGSLFIEIYISLQKMQNNGAQKGNMKMRKRSHENVISHFIGQIAYIDGHYIILIQSWTMLHLVNLLVCI